VHLGINARFTCAGSMMTAFHTLLFLSCAADGSLFSKALVGSARKARSLLQESAGQVVLIYLTWGHGGLKRH
jgi:hypothetical protein